MLSGNITLSLVRSTKAICYQGDISGTFQKKNMNASRPCEHPQVRGENVKTFRWDHRLQIQNIFMAFKRVPR